MELVKVKRNYQITIPQSLRKKISIDVGDYVQVETRKGQIIIKPVKVIHPDQEYFYSKQWQAKEAEADQEISRGDMVGPFDKAEDALKALKKAKI